jgi:sugar lactone lactonase YvrE
LIRVFSLILSLSAFFGASTASASILSTHTLKNDFAWNGQGDGQVELTAGGIQLMKQADSVAAFASGGILPLNFHYASAWATEDAMYMAGGADSGAYRSSIYSAPFTSSTTLGSWTLLGNFSAGWGQANVARWKDWVYMAGGYNTAPTGVIRRAQVLPGGALGAFSDVGTFSGGTVDTLPRMAVVKGRLFVVHGFTGSAGLTAVRSAPILADGSLGAWETRASRAAAVWNTGLAAASGSLTLFGGDSGGSSLTQVRAADIADDGTLTWDTSLGSLPQIASWHSGMESDGAGRVFGAGGYTGSGFIKKVYSAPLSANGKPGAWALESQDLPSNQAVGDLLVAKGSLWYLGGHNGVTATSAISCAPLNLNATGNAAQGTYDGVFDLGSVQAVGSLQWDASFPASVQGQLRIADASMVFSAWTSLSSGAGANIGASARYVEYRLVLSNPGAGNTLEVTEVRLDSGSLPTATPTATATSMPSSTPSPTPTLSATPLCTTAPDISVSAYQALPGAIGKPGDLLMQMYDQPKILGRSADGQWYLYGDAVGSGAGMSVIPNQPQRLIARNATLSNTGTHNVSLHEADGSRNLWGKVVPIDLPAGGAFEPGSSTKYWVSTNTGMLYRFNGVNDTAPEIRSISPAMSEVNALVFGPGGAAFITYGGTIWKFDAGQMTASTSTATATLFSILPASQNLLEMIYDGSRWLYAVSYKGQLYRVDALTGAATLFDSYQDVIYGQSLGLSLDLDGNLWISHAGGSLPNGLVRLNLATMQRDHFPIPATVGGLAIFGQVTHLVTLGVALPHAHCVEGQYTPAVPASSSPTPSPSQTPTPSPTANLPTGTFTSTATFTPTLSATPLCTTAPDISVSAYQALPGAVGKPGDVLIQLAGQPAVLGMAENGTWYQFGTQLGNNPGGLSVVPGQPDKVVVRNGFVGDAVSNNVNVFDAAGNRTQWGLASDQSPVGGAFQPGSTVQWIGTLDGKLVRLNGPSDAAPQVKIPKYLGAAMPTLNSIAFGPGGALFMCSDSGLYKVDSAELSFAAPVATLVTNLPSTAVDLVYDGSQWIYVLLWSGQVYRVNPADGSYSLSVSYNGNGVQSYGLTMDLAGNLWVSLCCGTTPKTLARFNLASGVTTTFDLPSTVGGQAITGSPHRLAVIGVAQPHAHCVDGQFTPVPTASASPTSTPSPSPAASASPSATAIPPTSTVTRTATVPSATSSATLTAPVPSATLTVTRTVTPAPSSSPTSVPLLTVLIFTGTPTMTPSATVTATTVSTAVLGTSTATLSETALPNGPILIVAPNPSRGRFTVVFKVFRGQNISLTMTNLAGEVVYKLTQALDRGVYTQHLDLTLLASGTYFVTLEGQSKFGPPVLAQFKMAIVH